MTDCIVIGGGAAGLFAAGVAASGGLRVQLLEKNGIIRRESVESDARLKSLVPTKRAVELDTQVRACLRDTDRMLTRGISDGQVQLFKEIAAQMLCNLEHWDQEAADIPSDSRQVH